VGDVVRANLLATEIPLGASVPILNIGTGQQSSVNQLVRLLGQVVGREVARRYGPPRPGEQRRSCLDARLAKRVLGWEPKMSLRAGLEETFQWFQGRAHGAQGTG
jgi:UDP-glucose 4-epimerase